MRKGETKLEGGAGCAAGLFLFALPILTIPLWGWAAALVWGWFVVPVFGLPALLWWQAWGLRVAVAFFTPMPTDPDSEPGISSDDIIRRIVRSVFAPLMGLGIALVVRALVGAT